MTKNSIDPSASIDSWGAGRTELPIEVDLSVVVPAYNEYLRLPFALMDMIDYLDGYGQRYEIIVVDDGSSDQTCDAVNKFEKLRHNIRLIRLPRNCGKGHAVKCGMINARGTRRLFADADGATPFAELRRLTEALDNGADIAIGSRAKHSTETAVHTSFHRRLMGRVFNAIINILLVPGIEDTQCGFKLFTARSAQFIFPRLKSDGFGFDVELLTIAGKAGLKVAEVPVNWTNIPGSKVNLLLDPLRMLRDAIASRIWHRAVTPESYRQFAAQP